VTVSDGYFCVVETSESLKKNGEINDVVVEIILKLD
jgi:hypothetical protein